MDYKVYWVGERPGGAMVITVLDQESGLPANIAPYERVKMYMLDSKNRPVDLGNSETTISSGSTGRVVFKWPTDKSLFERPGEYVFQLELVAGEHDEVKVRTTVENIVVKRLGGI